MSKRILIVGSGGREYALARKFSEDPVVQRIVVVPGNDRMDSLPKCSIQQGDVVEIALHEQIDLVIIGPEKPLVDGLADSLRTVGIATVGPSKDAAQLEASKQFAKVLMEEMSIPTAQAHYATCPMEALKILDNWMYSDGVVVKVDGLAGGKGVRICGTIDEAKKAVFDFMQNPVYAIQTSDILLERRLYGREFSAFALCDGQSWSWLGVACDHKRLYDSDEGPNTGGMGAFTAAHLLTERQQKKIEEIFSAVLDGMSRRGMPFQGILFVGLMINAEGVHSESLDEVAVLEFNVRLGDPEGQVLLPTLPISVYSLFEAISNGTLSSVTAPEPLRDTQAVLHVVLTSKGYPGLGAEISTGVEIEVPSELPSNVWIDYAGVKANGERLLTAGGRVLGVTAMAQTIFEARRAAYSMVQQVHFDGMHYRRDIALNVSDEITRFKGD